MNRIACKHLAGGNWHYSCSFRTLSGICSVVATVVKNNDLSEHGFKLFKNICERTKTFVGHTLAIIVAAARIFEQLATAILDLTGSAGPTA